MDIAIKQEFKNTFGYDLDEFKDFNPKNNFFSNFTLEKLREYTNIALRFSFRMGKYCTIGVLRIVQVVARLLNGAVQLSSLMMSLIKIALTIAILYIGWKIISVQSIGALVVGSFKVLSWLFAKLAGITAWMMPV